LKIRVLVIDDDEDLLFLAGKFLTREDERIQLVSATTDQEALRLIEEEEFDAIVCDHFLGQGSMTGLELLEWVREFNPHIPFIIFTGRSQEAVAIRALNLGADYYLKKGTEEFRELFSQLASRIVAEVEERRQAEALESALNELEKRVEDRTADLTKANEQLTQEIAERKKMEESLALQRDLGNTLCNTENLIDALDRILKAAVQLEGINTGGIFLIDSDTGEFDLSTSQGMSAEFLKSILDQKEIPEISAPLYVSSSEIDETLKRKSDFEDLTAIAIVPILLDGKPVAILSLGSHSHEEIPVMDKHTLEAIAAQISAYIARMRAQQAIAQSQLEIMHVFDSLQDMLFIIDNTGLVAHTNELAKIKLGRKNATLDGESILKFYNQEDQEEISQILQGAMNGEVVVSAVPLKAVNGQLVKASTRFVKSNYSGKDVVFMVSHED
jgi:CheY-like chemotaxis protein